MEWFKRIPNGVWGVAVLVLLGAAFWPGREVAPPPLVAEEVRQAAAASDKLIMVHVSGEVACPGLYKLPPNSRAQDAVALAGGFLPSADTSRVNMAKRLKDGMQVRVPAAKSAKLKTPASPPETGLNGPRATGRAASPAVAAPLVAINRADEAALCSLPGIGPATARRIIAYRTEHGPFSAADDLLQVSGIGPTKLAAIRPQLTLE